MSEQEQQQQPSITANMTIWPSTLLEWAYVLVSMGTLGVICYVLWQLQLPITAMLLGATSALTLVVVYYFQWFKNPHDLSLWMPPVSACPDYLVQYGPNKCADPLGISQASPMPNARRLLKLPAGGLPTDGNTSDYILDFGTNSTLAAKAKLAQEYGLTWEGVI
jgi:hypothetical protein